MNKNETLNIKFIKSDSKEQEILISQLLNRQTDFIPQIDPNKIIKNLEFLVDTSFSTGSFGAYHECYKEYTIQNSPFSVLLIFLYENDLFLNFLKEQKITDFKGDFAQYFSTFEGKDSNSVDRYTFKNFHLSHLLVGQFENDDYENYLKTEENCGEFVVQHKSSLFMSSSDEKYLQGYKEKILDCNINQMRDLDLKILNKAEHTN